MEISKSSGTDGLTVAIKGRISWRETDAFKAQLSEIAQSNESRVMMDMTEVPFIDSAAIGTLVSFHAVAVERKIEVFFVVNPTVHGIMFESNLDKVFRIVENRDDIFLKQV